MARPSSSKTSTKSSSFNISSSTSRKQSSSTSSTTVDEEILIPLLAQKSYHIPGNSWKEGEYSRRIVYEMFVFIEIIFSEP